MNSKYLKIFFVSIVCISFSAFSKTPDQPLLPGGGEDVIVNDSEQFRSSMIDLLKGIEGAAGLPSDASQAYIDASPAEIETAYGFWQQKELLFFAVPEILNQIELAKHRPDYAKLAGPTTRAAPGTGATTMATPPVYPDYPTGLVYTGLEALGLVSTPGQRCGGQTLELYKSAIFGAEVAIYLGDRACTVAGCDPTGIVCASVCGAVELVKVGVEAAAMPIRWCQELDGEIDSAESSADFENGVSILADIGDITDGFDDLASDLAAHDAHINADLAAHNTHISANLAAHDAHINADLEAHDANIDADLVKHDADIKSLLGNVQTTLELMKRLHVDVIQIEEKKHYLLGVTEAGIPVSGAELVSLMAGAPKKGEAFRDIRTTSRELRPGVIEVKIKSLPSSVDSDTIFQFHVEEVGHGPFTHFGTALVGGDSNSTFLGPGQ